MRILLKNAKNEQNCPYIGSRLNRKSDYTKKPKSTNYVHRFGRFPKPPSSIFHLSSKLQTPLLPLPHAVGPAAHEVRGAIVLSYESRDVRQFSLNFGVFFDHLIFYSAQVTSNATNHANPLVF